jgi:hypothetical protein
VGHNRLISLLLALVVIAVDLRHGESLTLTHDTYFSYRSFCSKSNHWRNSPASMITRSNIAVICDVGYNHLISLLLALVVIAVELRHEESSLGAHAAFFPHGPL